MRNKQSVQAALDWANSQLLVIGDSDLLNQLATARFHAGILANDVMELQRQLDAIEEDGTEEHNAAVQLRQEVAMLLIERDSWRERFEKLEVERASCCWENEERAKRAEAVIADLKNQLISLAGSLA